MIKLGVDVEKPQGCSITNYFKNWANITQDEFFLYIVKFGLTMEFAEVPV